jgi:hypothetical protein
LFVTDTDFAAEMEGMIMCTTAHYMDVGPDVSDVGIGLKVNGQTNKTSYLKAFIPDTLLATWGVPVVMATNLLAGYTTHYNAQNVSEGDTTEVTTEFTRIAGGTNIVYAYNSGTSGDSGYEARLTFTFHSPVAAQIGQNSVEGDFDGDRLADPYWPVKSNVQGMWTIWQSSASYAPAEVLNTPLSGGEPIRVADFEGDGLADLVMVANGNWYIWLSSTGYQTPQGPSFTIPVPSASVDWVAGDFDGDRKADPVMVVNGVWTLWLSSIGYQPPQGLCLLSMTVSGGEVMAGDFDGDRKADPVMVVNGNWYFCYSTGGYAQQGPYYISVPGTDVTPMIGDFDGDGLSDIAAVASHNWTFWFSSEGYANAWGPYLFSP